MNTIKDRTIPIERLNEVYEELDLAEHGVKALIEDQRLLCSLANPARVATINRILHSVQSVRETLK